MYFKENLLNMNIIFYVLSKVLRVIGTLLFILFITTFSTLISYILGKFRIGPVVCFKDKIMTPVIYLENPNTNKKVVLIGMMHIGIKRYYEEIQKIIDSLSGYKILYESIGKLKPGQRKLFNDSEREAYKNLKKDIKSRTLISAILKLQGQKKGLNYNEESWIRTDMDIFDFIKKINKEKIKLLHEKLLKLSLKDKLDKDIARWLIQAILLKMNAFILIMPIINLFSRQKRIENDIILKERNQIALNGIFENLKDSNVASIWGAMHLIEMTKKLKKAGFKQVKKEWYVAYEKNPNYSKMIFATLKASTENKK